MLQVVDSGPGDPVWNMALDEALLESGGSWLRLYAWRPWALSLGYFQRLADFDDVARELPRVRRPTGGGAILHADELTLALALPEAQLRGSVAESYAVLNSAVARAARTFGAELRAPSGVPPHAPAAAARWCFAIPTGLDLVDPAGAKVFGSAQRRRGGRVLQHGSLVLRRHPLTPFTGALDAGSEDLSRALAREIAASLACDTTPVAGEDAIPEPVRQRAAELASTRYGNAAWTARR